MRHPFTHRAPALGRGDFAPTPLHTSVRRAGRYLADGLRGLLADTSCERCGEHAPAVLAPGRRRVPSLCACCSAALIWLPDAELPHPCRSCQEEPAERIRGFCARCRRVLGSDPALASATAAVAFEGRVRDWLHDFKYPRDDLALDASGEFAACALISRAAKIAPGARPGCVVPVPLHPVRLRARGFNPAAVLARRVGRDLRRPVDVHSLERIRNTPSQTGLDRSERRSNVADAFRVVQRKGRELPARVWLVDDVVTTGATLTAAARALRAAGVREVAAVCAARTLRGSGHPFA